MQKSALENLMSVKEFIVQILINHLGWILEQDPFLFVKFKEAFNSNPHAFRRLPVEIKTESNPHNDKIQRWIRSSLRSHAKSGYQVDITENELLDKVYKTKTCIYCGVILRYIKSKGINRNLYAQVDRIFPNQTTLTNESVRLICTKCNFKKLNMGHEAFVEYCHIVS